MTLWRDDIEVAPKDPGSEEEPRGLDYTKLLAELGDGVTITNSVWSVTEGNVTITDMSIVTGSKQTQFKMSGGSEGQTCKLRNHFTCSQGMKDYRSITFKVRAR